MLALRIDHLHQILTEDLSYFAHFCRYDNVYISVFPQRPHRGDTFTLFSRLYSMSCPSEVSPQFQSLRWLLRLLGS
jgi:hypothetical protein